MQVGYGDIVPANNTERLYALMSQLMGMFIFGYLLSTVGRLLSNADQNAVRVNDKLDEVNVYLRWHRFPPELATRVKRYFSFYYSRKSAMDEESIIASLAPTLRRDVLVHLLGRTVANIPIFSTTLSHGGGFELLLAVYHALTPMLREAKEPIAESLEMGAKCSSHPRTIYFLRRGTLEALGQVPDTQYFEVAASTEEGSILGEHALMGNATCFCSYRAKTRCELYALGVAELRTIIAPLTIQQRDEMADMVYNSHTQRHVLRCISHRHTIMKGLFASTELRAALLLQFRCMQQKTSRLLKAQSSARLYPSFYAELVPGLYQALSPEVPEDVAPQSSRRRTEVKTYASAPVVNSTAAPPDAVARLSVQLGLLQAQLDRLEEKVAHVATPDDWMEKIKQAVRVASYPR